MMVNLILSQPKSLEKSNFYLYRERDSDGHRRPPSVVKFINYDPCPAFVIIQILDGSRLRCLREDIFSTIENDQKTSINQLSAFFRRQVRKVGDGHKSLQ